MENKKYTLEELKVMYQDENLNTFEISRKTNMAESTIRGILKRNGLIRETKRKNVDVLLDGEIVVPIKNTSDYFISNLGRVLRIEKNIELKPVLDQKGYHRLRIYQNDKTIKTCKLHRLVAEYFVEGFSEGLQVNHIDGVKTNNNYTNLEWVNNYENQIHAIDTGLVGDKIILNKDDVINICNLLNVGELTHKEIVAELNLNISHKVISDIKRGKRWGRISKSILK